MLKLCDESTYFGSSMIIKDYMTTSLVTLPVKATLAEARELMESKRIRQVPVVESDGKLAGIISKRDLFAASMSNMTEDYERHKKVIESRLSVADAMTTDVTTIDASDSLTNAALRLQELRVGALPVISDGKLVGIISSSDFLGIAVMLLEK